MVPKKRFFAFLMGIFTLGISWQTMTVSADDVAEAQVPSSDVTNAQTDVRATAGAVASAEPSTNQDVASPVPVATSNQTTETYDSTGYGADVPYTSYEAEDATLANGAVEQHSTDTDSTAVEASNQKYVELPNQGSSVSFQVAKPANAINVRYTIPDGSSGKLDVQVNGNSVANLDLSSYSAWQYMNKDVPQDSFSDGTRARFRFDETHALLNGTQLQAGDTITLVKNAADNVAYGIDFIELEQVGQPLAQEENAISITSKGAVANDGVDDSQALLAAIDEAKATGKNVYIPEGQFDFDRKIGIDASNLKISGAGMWYTKLHFTSDQPGGGGFDFNHNDNAIEFSHVFMDSNLTSRYNQQAQYKAIAGTLGKDSYIHDIWEQHFECGMWIGDYDGANMKYTDNLRVENARIRNNLADGINFAQGTKNSTVSNSNIRGNGDDGLAAWSSISEGTNPTIDENNKFLHNTIELGWRAAGVGLFGGKGHEVAYNLIKDQFAGAGVRVNTVFPGYNFDSNDTGISIHDNYLMSDGTLSDLYEKPRAAVDLEAQLGAINNIAITDNKIMNSVSQAYQTNDPDHGNVRFENNTIGTVAISAPKPISTNPSAPTDTTNTPDDASSENTPTANPEAGNLSDVPDSSEQPSGESSSSSSQEEPAPSPTPTEEASQPSNEGSATLSPSTEPTETSVPTEETVVNSEPSQSTDSPASPVSEEEPNGSDVTSTDSPVSEDSTTSDENSESSSTEPVPSVNSESGNISDTTDSTEEASVVPSPSVEPTEPLEMPEEPADNSESTQPTDSSESPVSEEESNSSASHPTDSPVSEAPTTPDENSASSSTASTPTANPEDGNLSDAPDSSEQPSEESSSINSSAIPASNPGSSEVVSDPSTEETATPSSSVEPTVESGSTATPEATTTPAQPVGSSENSSVANPSTSDVSFDGEQGEPTSVKQSGDGDMTSSQSVSATTQSDPSDKTQSSATQLTSDFSALVSGRSVTSEKQKKTDSSENLPQTGEKLRGLTLTLGLVLLGIAVFLAKREMA